MTPSPRPKPDEVGAGKRPWRRTQGAFALGLLAPAVVVVFGIIVYPMVQTGVYAATDVASAMQTSAPFVGLGNFRSALGRPQFWASMGRTLYFTVVSTGVELLLGLGIAGLLNARIRGRWLLRTLVVIPWAVPTVVSGALWKGIFNAQYGSLNALLAQFGLIDKYQIWLGTPFLALNMVIVADVWKTVPVVAFMLLAGLTSIPDEVYEAARIDRAGRIRTLTSITLPLLLPSISIVLVLRVIEAFKVFDIIYAMTRGGPANGTMTIAYYTYMTAFSDQRYGLGSALAYLIVIVIAGLSALYLRALRRSEMSLL
ncbi:MAG: sugar ABC transporter permease [Propionibacteriaceae bacterium]|jgi:multiple sugar transport system permease protein/N,N'-diacetylchitobiose transport system permease protein|nr:sugar ABC transporter permease [Propionibacteriaceae bacterium]